MWEGYSYTHLLWLLGDLNEILHTKKPVNLTFLVQKQPSVTKILTIQIFK